LAKVQLRPAAPAGRLEEELIMRESRLITLWLLAAGLACTPVTAADDSDTPTASPPSNHVWNVHFQATSIGQHHGSFPSLYEGLNSLPAESENRASITSTMFLSIRLGRHWEFVVNPEIAGGKGFGEVTGIAGFPNGEIPRVATATPTLYLARGYVRFTVPLGTETKSVADAANQVASPMPVQRISFLTGKFAVTDFFDANSYSHDPRTQFMNWSLMSNGAWDYPADTRGYTAGAMQEIRMPHWSFRSAYVMEPTEANGPTLDTRIGVNRGVAVEFEHDHSLAGRGGAVRVLAFDNRERSGTYRDALHINPSNPDLGSTRRNGTRKYGFGLNLEQAIRDDIGVFGRYGWNDGKTETWAFTEIDRSASGGISIGGRRWRRPHDTVGAAVVRNYLSGDHRAFLAAGGYGFIIGDGRINYRPEQIFEAYYAFRIVRSWTLTADYQQITNPAYNRDRGPVSVGTIRIHFEL
jgi:high affinity Mn2+ porin